MGGCGDGILGLGGLWRIWRGAVVAVAAVAAVADVAVDVVMIRGLRHNCCPCSCCQRRRLFRRQMVIERSKPVD